MRIKKATKKVYELATNRKNFVIEVGLKYGWLPSVNEGNSCHRGYFAAVRCVNKETHQWYNFGERTIGGEFYARLQRTERYSQSEFDYLADTLESVVESIASGEKLRAETHVFVRLAIDSAAQRAGVTWTRNLQLV